MIDCTNIRLILEDEFIGDSLEKINTNFQELTGVACNLKEELDKRVNIFTFFYYGPNSATLHPPTVSETIGDLQISRPSNTTIENFVNKEEGLSLPSQSRIGDYAWIIYQKTGWRNIQQVKSGSTGGRFPVSVIANPKIGTRTVWVTWSASASFTDIYNFYSPIFIIYKLQHVTTQEGSEYKVLPSEPNKPNPAFNRSVTASTQNWNKPHLWNIY